MSYKKRTGFNFVLVCFLLSIASLNVFAGEFTVFNKTYIRGTGSPTSIVDNFNVPNPNTTWTLKAINGSLEDDTVEMVSSSTLLLNNEEILQSNQFNQNTNLITVPVTLNSTNTISTTLKGKPGGQLTIEIVGIIDDTVPLIFNLTPSSGALLNNSQPRISAQYSDDISGIDINSLVILLDGNDVVSESNITLTSFDFTPNDPLNDGIHTLIVSVQDNAGNLARLRPIFFTTDITPPVLTGINPADGSTTSTAQPTISANYSDATSGIDINSAKITLDGADITSQVAVTQTIISFTSLTPLAEGVHTAIFEVKDLAGNSNTVQTNFTIPTPNTTPTIGSIGNRSVPPGRELNFTVSASDPDNDNITLIVVPLPLPDNASFNRDTGLFQFTPDVTQAGASFVLTFIASDGSLTDSEEITITVNSLPATGITSLIGQILDANDAENGITTPIVGAIVKNIATGLSTLTNGAGNFALTGISSGINHFEYNGNTVTASDGSSYGAYVGNKDIIANVANFIDRPIYLMRIDTTGEAEVDPASTTVINNTNLNVTLTIPPNTVKDENGNDYTGMISISEVPAEFTPASLPDNLGPGMVFSVQPMGLTFEQPVPVTFPNFDNLTPGSEVDIWSLNHVTGKFFITGTGEVRSDGSVIDTIAGGLVGSSWFFSLSPPPELLAVAGDDPDHSESSDNHPNKCTEKLASGYVIQTGNFFEDYTFPPYRTLGASRVLKFNYNSTSAYPCPIITTQTSLPVNTAVPIAISTGLSIGGINFDNRTFKQGTSDLARQSSMFNATNLESGNYLYFLETKSHYSASTVSRGNVGNVIVNNQINSPFGAGWTLDGIQKLHDLNSPDGRVLLTEGNGSAKMFTTKLVGTGAFSDPTIFPVGIESLSIATGDFNGDNVLDFATVNEFSVSILIGDGVGNFTALTDIPVGGAIFSIISGDFNGDNILDLAATDRGGFIHRVHILIGDGAGNFLVSTNSIDFGRFPNSIIANDLNGDNVLDFAKTNGFLPGGVTILIGDGVGNVLDRTTINFPSGIAPDSITAGDFNGDNVLDLATANPGSDNVSILIGDGVGNFSILTNFTVSDGPTAITTGDFNGDNVLDLATPNSRDDTVTILIGDGTGSFSPPLNLSVGDGPISIVTGDFNGDNVLDLATANSGSANVSILIGDGVGNFSAQTNFPVGGTLPFSIVTGDFNGDNVLDLATVNYDSGNVSILIGLTTEPEAPAGDFSTLVKNEDSTFTRTMKNGTQINFDANGLHTSTVDRNGNTTTYTYDPDELLTTITDPAGVVTTLNYQNGRLSSVTDPVGRIANFQHDNNGNLTKIIAPEGSILSYTYDSRHLMTTETDPNGNTHTISYSFAGRFQSMDFADGSTKQLSPSLQKGLVDISSGVGDSASNPDPNNVLATDINSTLTDGNGNVTITKTDNFGAITESTDNCCLGRITEIERDEDGLPTRITKANGAVTINTYDDNGNLLASNDQSIGATTTFTYEPKFNRVTSITDPNGKTTTINYDATGNPIVIVDAQSNTTTQTFNSQGQLTGVTDALGNTTAFTYNANGNLETTTDPLGNVTTLTTDSAGNIITATDANGNVTQFVYDTLNRLTQVTDANGDITNYSYDANGNLTQVTDANGNVTTFAYDSMDRLVTNTDPLGNSDTFAYDGNENLITTTDRNGQTLNFQYDSLNQLINKTLPANLVTTFDYDLVGNLTSISDPDSNLTFSYDGADRLTTTATTGSPNQPDVTINYTYDFNGNRQTMTDSLTGPTNYLYDTLNRITTITNPANQAVSFGYDILSRRVSTTLPNGVTTDFVYDSNSRLTSLQHKLGLTTLSDFSYTYDNVGNRTTMNTTRTGLTVNSSLNYVYDNIYQLTQATRPLPAQPDETFNYDPLGNRLLTDGQTTNSTIGQANRLLDDTAFTYSYDNNGNLIQKTDKVTNETTDYIYNAENKLIRINLPGGSIAQYRYDALGRRIEKDVDGVVTRYIYDGEDILLEIDGTNTQIARFTHGFGIDEPLIMARGGQSLFYQTDGLGSIIDLTDINGAVVQSYVYNSFGNIEQQVGNVVNPYTYTGREIDTESGLYFYRARYYDSITGRFINEDPIGFAAGDNNFYRYVQNNPINFVDPDGRFLQSLIAGGIAGTITGGITFVAELAQGASFKDAGKAAAISSVTAAVSIGLASTGVGLVGTSLAATATNALMQKIVNGDVDLSDAVVSGILISPGGLALSLVGLKGPALGVAGGNVAAALNQLASPLSSTLDSALNKDGSCN